MPKNKEIQPFAVAKDAYAMAVDDNGESGNIKLYGRVVDARPINWLTCEKDDSDYIVQSEFLEDLKNLKDCKNINISLSSVGGMVSVGFVIHNKLREMAGNGAKITCTVDGVAMSAGSVIMCAADTVKAYPSSMIMVHKSSIYANGQMNADELRKAAETLDSYDSAIVAVYKRKTGKEDAELLELMKNETYMVGSEAKESGFVDEIIEDDKGLKISASADKTYLVVGEHILPLEGYDCPSNIPVAEATQNSKSTPESVSAEVDDKSNIATEGGNEMANEPNVPVAQTAQTLSASEDEIQKAILGERERLSKIDAIAAQFGADIVADAKYKKPCTAEEMAYKAALENAKKGAKFLDDVEEDTKNSNANKVTAASAPEDKPAENLSDAENMAKAKAQLKDLLGGDE